MPNEPFPQKYEADMISLESLVRYNPLLSDIDQYIDFGFIRDRVRLSQCAAFGAGYVGQCWWRSGREYQPKSIAN